MAELKPTNQRIASILEQIAELLEAQEANPHRVRAYRNGAQRVRAFPKSVSQIVLDGHEADLEHIPDIGSGLANVISSYVKSGRSEVLERLQGEVSPQDLFQRVPGIGPELAKRITNELDISSLAELELAAYDGRLSKIDGFGPKRIKMVRTSLAGMLSQSARRAARQVADRHRKIEPCKPRVELLLHIDQEYRRKAQSGELRKIAPRRFNPDEVAWLPIMHSESQGWDITALFSNTERAHRLKTTHDWVVVYYEQDGIEGQATIVTQLSGVLAGKRVVRGREAECEVYYRVEQNAL